MHLASALFSGTKSLIYSIMVKQGPKIRFNFHNIKTDACFPFYKDLPGLISRNKFDKYLERRY